MTDIGAKNLGFITFEGVDGSGKTTQTRMLAEALAAGGRETVLTREPGGSSGAEDIRVLLTTGNPDRWSAYTELLLFNAARRDHLEKTIEPALQSGKIVICDRFADSSRVYQGVARGELSELVEALHQLVIKKEPDLTFILDIDPSVSLSRGLARGSGEDRFEAFGLEFQRELRRGFLALAEHYSERCVVINAAQTVSEISRDILSHVSARI